MKIANLSLRLVRNINTGFDQGLDVVHNLGSWRDIKTIISQVQKTPAPKSSGLGKDNEASDIADSVVGERHKMEMGKCIDCGYIANLVAVKIKAMQVSKIG